MNSSNGQPSTVRQTIVETLEAPRLIGIETINFVEFKKKRTTYERQLSERNAEQNTCVPKTTLRNSIDDDLLRLFIQLGWVPEDDIEKISEESLRICIEKQSEVLTENYDIIFLDHLVKQLRMDMKIPSLKSRVCKLAFDYQRLLSDHGYGSFITKQSILAIQHVRSRLYHRGLKELMDGLYRLNKEKYKNNYSLFLQHLCEQADKLDASEGISNQKHSQTWSVHQEKSHNSNQVFRPFRAKHTNSHGNKSKITKKRGREDDQDQNPREMKRKEPPCINPKCSGFHMLRNCPLVKTISERRRILNAWREKRKEKQNIGAISTASADEDSSVFKATFLGNRVETTAIADTGADVSIISYDLLQEMKTIDGQLEIEILDHTVYFSLADVRADPLPCSRALFQFRLMFGMPVSLIYGILIGIYPIDRYVMLFWEKTY